MKISKSTIVRTILVTIVIINFILEKFGLDLIPTDESKIAMFVEVAVEIGTIIAAWWKNNSFSEAAIRADEFMKELREDETDWSYEPELDEEEADIFESEVE